MSALKVEVREKIFYSFPLFFVIFTSSIISISVTTCTLSYSLLSNFTLPVTDVDLCLGTFSRRNSHCSIIQTCDNVMLVQCTAQPHMEVDQRKSLDITEDLSQMITSSSTTSTSSSSSSSLDLNIRQMEETQRRINVTLENLLKLRQQQQHQKSARNYQVSGGRPHRESLSVSAAERKRQSLETIKRSGNEDCHLIRDKEQNFLPQQMKDQDSCRRLTMTTDCYSVKDVTNNNVNKQQQQSTTKNNNTNNENRNSYQYPIDSPVKSRIQGLINSVKNLKNRNSVEKEDRTEFSRERKSVRTKETFSVEDFTELIRNLPANHFPQERIETDQLNESQNLSKQNENKVFHIVKEMMTSEQDFVSNLSLICEDFTNFLLDSSQQVCQPEFDNLPEILQLSRQLHQEFQYRFQHWEEIHKISDVFLSHRAEFKVYLRYLRNFSNVNKHFDECHSKNPEFRNLCESFEKLPSCRNLKLKHFLLKPVQRLPQYKLLLADYLKHLENEGEDYQDSLHALQMITELLKNANDVIL